MIRLLQRSAIRGEPLESRLCLSAITFVEKEPIGRANERNAVMAVADVDGDGDLDAISSLGQWYENTGGNEQFSEAQPLISTDAEEFRSIIGTDIDGDQDIDLLGRSLNRDHGAKIELFQNIGGKFGPPRLLGLSDRIPSMITADLDNDSDIDVLYAKSQDDNWVITLLKNNEGFGTFTEQTLVTTECSLNGIVTGDLDSDGDLDVVSGYGNRICSFTNDEGRFFERRFARITSNSLSLALEDLDGDADLDVLTGDAWFENSDGRGEFLPKSQFPVDFGFGGSASIPLDVDSDGDIDVIQGAAINHAPGALAWYENLDGKGGFGDARFINRRDNLLLFGGDFDNDGNQDIISSFNGAAFYENRLIGDSNDDGIFNSTDLVEVFVTGKYEDGIPDNATFDEGDWNQDGEFDSGDLVFAFQAGNYVTAVMPNKSQIATSIDLLFADDEDLVSHRCIFCFDETHRSRLRLKTDASWRKFEVP